MVGDNWKREETVAWGFNYYFNPSNKWKHYYFYLTWIDTSPFFSVFFQVTNIPVLVQSRCDERLIMNRTILFISFCPKQKIPFSMIIHTCMIEYEWITLLLSLHSKTFFCDPKISFFMKLLLNGILNEDKHTDQF